MKRKTFALLLSAMLAVQPVSVVLAEDMLSSGTESTEIIQETEPQAATLTNDMFTDAGENSPNLVGGGTEVVTEEKSEANAKGETETDRQSDTTQSTDYGIQIYHESRYIAVTSDNAENVLGDGTVSYAADTNTLTLNGANLRCDKNGKAAISVPNEGSMLRLELIGQNIIIGDKCIDVKPDLVITGEGALEMQGHRSGLYAFNNLTIDGVNIHADVVGNEKAIQVAGVLKIINSKNMTVYNESGDGIYASGGVEIINSNVTSTVAHNIGLVGNGKGLKITDSTVNVSSGNGMGIIVTGDEGNIHISGSTVTAETSTDGSYAVYADNNVIEISDSKVTATANGPESIGIYGGSSLVISDQSQVTAISTFPALYSETGTTISNSMVNATSDDVAIFARAGGVRIENGANVIANGYWPAIRGNKEVVISGSKVDATSSNDVAIFTPKSLIITDSIVDAKGNANYDGIKGNNTVEVSDSWISTSGDETFADSNNYVLINGVTGVVIGNAVVPGNITIPAGTTIKVPSDSSLTIPQNVTLTNYGKVNGEGEIHNHGTVNCNNHSGGTATCTTTATCDLCGVEYGSPNGHKLQKVEGKKPTCTGTGNVEYWYCTVCDKNFVDSQGTQELDNMSLPALGHLWDEGVITKEPTCTEPGIRTCTCKNCGWTLKKEITPTGHNYEGVIRKATFTKDGAVSGVCKDCGNEIKEEVIPQVSQVELSNTEYTYNGTNRQPKVVLKDRNGKELKPEEYSVTYAKESKVPGTYELTIALKGNYYEGTLTKEYTVKKGNQVIGFEDMTKRIDSKTVTLKAEILQGNKTGRFGYRSSNPEVASVTSWGRVTFHKVGKAEITAMTRGSANYNSAQKTITLTVAPVPTVVTKLQSQNPGWLNIQYRANPNADGYQIQYGASPDMKGAKHAAVKNPAIRSYTRTDAKSGEIYYVRVRTYNVVDGERIYSNWSGIKSVEVK